MSQGATDSSSLSTAFMPASMALNTSDANESRLASFPVFFFRLTLQSSIRARYIIIAIFQPSRDPTGVDILGWPQRKEIQIKNDQNTTHQESPKKSLAKAAWRIGVGMEAPYQGRFRISLQHTETHWNPVDTASRFKKTNVSWHSMHSMHLARPRTARTLRVLAVPRPHLQRFATWRRWFAIRPWNKSVWFSEAPNMGQQLSLSSLVSFWCA